MTRLLIHAAELLEREAGDIRREYLRAYGWADAELEQHHDDMIATAAALREAARERVSEDEKFCCIHAWKAAKNAAWGSRSLRACRCDHNEYCDRCWPFEFRPGGKWDEANAPQAAPRSEPR